MTTKNDDDTTTAAESGEETTTTCASPAAPAATMLERARSAIRAVVVFLGTSAARRPTLCCVVVGSASLTLVGVGFLTNFTMILDLRPLLTPIGCASEVHHQWIESDDGFPRQRTDALQIFVHNDGDDVLGDARAVTALAEALRVVFTTPGYAELCASGAHVDADGRPDCRVLSATRYWNHDLDRMTEDLSSGRVDLVDALSAAVFPDGVPVSRDLLLGHATYVDRDDDDDDDGTTPRRLARADSLRAAVLLPAARGGEDELARFLEAALSRLARRRSTTWNNPDVRDGGRVDVLSILGYVLEYERALDQDKPLIGGVFGVMLVFTCLVFLKTHKIESRTLVGVGSILTISLSMMTGFGLMFLIGVPFTILTQLLPFIVLGVGLDDTFIITGEYFRRRDADPDGDVVERVRDTLDTVGLGISLTTMTTVTAFLLGYISSFPGVRWVCLYAVVTIFVDFLFQITFFVALLVLNERRIAARRRDCCLWIVVPEDAELTAHDEDEEDDDEDDEDEEIHRDDQQAARETVSLLRTPKEEEQEKDTTPASSKDDEEEDHEESEEEEEQKNLNDDDEEAGQETEHQLLRVQQEEEDVLMDVPEEKGTLPALSKGDDEESKEEEEQKNLNDDDEEANLETDTLPGLSQNEDEDDHNKEQKEEDSLCAVETAVPTMEKPRSPQSQSQSQSQQKSQQPQAQQQQQQQQPKEVLVTGGRHLADRFMRWYADVLLRPTSKIVVLLSFALLFTLSAYSASNLEQEFDILDYVPADSYIRDYIAHTALYSEVAWTVEVHFRDLDQSDPDAQDAMIDYIDAVTSSENVGDGAAGPCWVRDLRDRRAELVARSGVAESALRALPAHQLLDLALEEDPVLRELYGQDIVRDERTGEIVNSRCRIVLRDVDFGSVRFQTDMLRDQRDASARHPLNAGLAVAEWRAFTFDKLYFTWEAYVIAVRELVFTVSAGAVAVTVIAFLFMPHWSAVCFLSPVIVALYVNYFGCIQLFGLHINAMTYMCVVMSIGLLVDFLMHILIRYYETPRDASRETKVRRTLETMGASVALGGATTFLGVLLMVFGSTRIWRVVFVSFSTVVVLGVLHGLVFLPAVLSVLGPEQVGPETKDEPRDATGRLAL